MIVWREITNTIVVVFFRLPLSVNFGDGTRRVNAGFLLLSPDGAQFRLYYPEPGFKKILFFVYPMQIII